MMTVNPSRIDLPALARPLKERIKRGSALLFDMEQHGETGAQYQSWVATYVRLVEDYDVLTQCILRGKTSIEAVAPLPPPLEPDPEQAPLELEEAK